VKTKGLSAFILLFAGVLGARGADLNDVKSVLERFKSVRPTEADLGLYQLDWIPTLKEARERAAKEARPIFLVVVTNSFGDLFSGHC
jgi:hypothetical protein